MTKYVTFFVVAVYLGSSIGRAETAASPGDGPRTAASHEQDTGLPDWMTSYYQNPQPDQFVAKVRQMSDRGTLSAPVTGAFLSRVLAKNPARIAVWMAALADLPDKDKTALHKAIKEICDGLLNGNELNPTETQCLKAMLANLNAHTDAKNNPSPGDPAENPGLVREWTKAEQRFGAMLYFSDKPQQFVDDWCKPGETANVAASCSHSVARGTPCVAFIVFTGCGAVKQGLADVVADISMLTPDGKVIGERKGVEICQKRPAPPDKQLQLGVGNLGMVLLPELRFYSIRSA